MKTILGPIMIFTLFAVMVGCGEKSTTDTASAVADSDCASELEACKGTIQLLQSDPVLKSKCMLPIELDFTDNVSAMILDHTQLNLVYKDKKGITTICSCNLTNGVGIILDGAARKVKVGGTISGKDVSASATIGKTPSVPNNPWIAGIVKYDQETPNELRFIGIEDVRGGYVGADPYDVKPRGKQWDLGGDPLGVNLKFDGVDEYTVEYSSGTTVVLADYNHPTPFTKPPYNNPDSKAQAHFYRNVFF
jgi:hypothetical protein